MSAITTSEELQKLLAVIFGYIGERTEIPAGDVIGPSRATKTLVNNLTEKILEFLRAYNGMLHDYAGAEIFAIEFQLVNYQEREKKTRIFPKAMVFVPGKWKDNQNLVIALKPEVGMLDAKKARKAMDQTSALFTEIEEIADRPDFSDEKKKILLTHFAQRFARKIQSDLIEGKWERKLVGLSQKSRTGEETHEVCSIVAERDITWLTPSPEIIPGNPRFRSPKLALDNEEKIEHYKFAMAPQGAFFIAQNTFKLASNLLELANSGSINEIQSKVISLFLQFITRGISGQNSPVPLGELESLVKEKIAEIRGIFTEFIEVGNQFTLKGEKGTQEQMFISLAKHYGNQKSSQKTYLRKILDIFILWSKETTFELSTELRSSEFKSNFLYFMEIVKASIHLIETNLSGYLAKSIQEDLLDAFVDFLRDQFQGESKSSRALGFKFLEKFHQFFKERLVRKYLFENTYSEALDIVGLENEFFSLIRNHLDEFLSTVPINIPDLLGFAEEIFEGNLAGISKHLDRFKVYEREIILVRNLILRYSTLNRFIQDHAAEIFDPESFANKFYEFSRKRLGGFLLKWKEYGLDWIKKFQAQFQPLFENDLDEGKQWEASKVIELFIKFINQTGKDISDPDHFVTVIDEYIANLPPCPEKGDLIAFLKNYEESLGISKAFPEYLKKQILKHLEEGAVRYLSKTPVDYFLDGDENVFFDYLTAHHLRYYSSLLAEPTTILLKNYDYDPGEDLTGDLFFQLDFNYTKNRVKISTTSNWYDIKSPY